MSLSATEPQERVGSYQFATEIGKGSFAVVRKGYDTRRPRTAVAIKVVSRAILTKQLIANLEAEISILQSIAHPNVVELIDCIKNDDRIYLIMPFCPWGDLSMYIKSHGELPSSPLPSRPKTDPIFHQNDLGASVIANSALMASAPDEQAAIDGLWADVRRFKHPAGGGLNPWVVRSFLFQLCSALEFMWGKHIVHRDIKPQNLLLQPADPTFLASGHPLGIPQIKVADFGFARHLPAASLAETLCGSPLYMAPEILRYEKYDAKADLWSVGAVTYEMASGKPPFRAANHIELLRRIEKNDDRIRFPDERSDSSLARENARREEDGLPLIERAPAVPEDLKAVIRSLLKRHSVNRAGFDEIFHSPVVASGSGPELAKALGLPVPRPALPNPLPPPPTEPPPVPLPSVSSAPNRPHPPMGGNSGSLPTPSATFKQMTSTITARPPAVPPATTGATEVTVPAPAPTSAPFPFPAPAPAPAPATVPASSLAHADTHVDADADAPDPALAPAQITPQDIPEQAYPPRRSQSKSPPHPGAVPVPGVGARQTPHHHAAYSVPMREVNLPRRPRLQASSLLGTSPAFVKGGVVPSSLPDSGSAASARPPFQPARKTTVGFKPASPSSLSRSPAAPNAPAADRSSSALHRSNSARAKSTGLPQLPSSSRAPAQTSTPAPSLGFDVATALHNSGVSSSSTSPRVAPSAPNSPGRQSARDTGSLLDGEYAIVEARTEGQDSPSASLATGPAAGSGKQMVAFPASSYPSTAQAAASAAVSAAAAAFGRAPIRRLSQIRAPSFSRISSAARQSFSPVSPTTFGQPALLPDRSRKDSGQNPAGLSSALSSNKPPPVTAGGFTPRPMTPGDAPATAIASGTASASKAAGSSGGSLQTGGLTSGTAHGMAGGDRGGPSAPSTGSGTSTTPTLSRTGPGLPSSPATPTGTGSQARPLPIPRPAFALPAHQRPASFHRRPSTSFSSSGHSMSPRAQQGPGSFTGGAGFSPIPSGSDGPEPGRRTDYGGVSAPAGAAYTPAFGGASPRTPPLPLETGSTAGFGTSPTSYPTGGNGSSADGHLARGTSISPSPSSYPPPPGALSSSLTRAMSQASIRLFGIPSGVALRNAQAIMRGRTWRSQSLSGAGTGMSTHSLLGGATPPLGAVGAGTDGSAFNLPGEPDQAERNMLGLMIDYFHKAHVLSELADSMFADQFGAPPFPASAGQVSEYEWRDPTAPATPSRLRLGAGAVAPSAPAAPAGRSSSSLSLASASAAANEPGTPGTTPSSTPFSSAGVLGVGMGSISLAASYQGAADSEGVAAECLLIYLRAAGLIDRGLQTTREFLDARQANGWTRRPCPDLMELSYALKSSFQALFERVEYARSQTGEEDELHPTRNINDLILSMAMDVARAAATDEMNRTRQISGQTEWNSQRCIDAYDAAETLLLSLLEPSTADEPGNSGLSPATTAFIEKYVHSIDKRLDNLHQTFGRSG